MDLESYDNFVASVFSSAEIGDLANLVNDSAASLGLMLRTRSPENAYQPIPVTLFPTFVSSAAVEKIVKLQAEINLLMHCVAHDRNFLNKTLEGAIAVDDFTRNLYQIYCDVNFGNQNELALIRTDFIQHLSDPSRRKLSETVADSEYKMVEVNMICVGLAGICSHVPAIHQKILHRLSDIPPHQRDVSRLQLEPDVIKIYGNALAEAYSVYCSDYPSNRTKAMLLMVHGGFEFNIMDQRMVEAASGIFTIRRSFKEAAESVKVAPDGALYIDGYEIAVVYYRTGYAPDQYKDEEDWEVRRTIELSRAFKCPSVAYQLAGCKKVQQELCRKGVLERYIQDPLICEQLRSTFVGQWDLSDPDSRDSISESLKRPDDYVLKPNREGGGNNFYGRHLVEKIEEVQGTPSAAGYILMEKIKAPTQTNILVRPGSTTGPELKETISEIGVFGTIVSRNGQAVQNLFSNQLLVRSKSAELNEGGLASGFSCLSSAFLV